MNTPLVSICSPCYNVAPYIGRFLDSILEQSYKNLELILVNDGSTDSTDDVILAYIPRLEAAGCRIIYIKQHNQGQSAALNVALKHIHGKYFTWPDPDDYLTPDSIESRIKFLEQHDDIALVRGHMEMIDEETGNSKGYLDPVLDSDGILDDLFEALFYKFRIHVAALANMARTSVLDELIPNREIYTSRWAGQNWQLLLPIAHKYKCWHMQKVMGYYLVRQNSHSHASFDYEQQIEKEYAFQNTLVQTLSKLSDIHTKYINWAICTYSYERLCYAKFYKKRGDIWKFSKELLAVTPGLIQKGKIILEALYHCIVKPIISR